MQVPVYEPVYMGVMHVHMDMAMVMVMVMDMDMDMVMVMDMCDVSVLYGSLLSDCPSAKAMAYPNPSRRESSSTPVVPQKVL